MARTKKKKKEINNRRYAVVYARYSSSAQTEQSIEGQMTVNTEFAERNDYKIVNTYIDRAMTGRNDDRPAFKQMIKDSYNGDFDYIIVYKLDRFSRNRYDSAINKGILRENGVKVISATESISDTPEGLLFESVLEGFNEYYSAELSQKIKRGIRESHKKGFYTGGSVPLGYDLVDRKLVINEDEANIVRWIFQKCSSGTLLKNIANELNAKKIKSKTKTEFSQAVISRIVNNRHYLGVAEFDDEVYYNIYPQIIEESLFEMCQYKNTLNSKRAKHFCYNTYLLSGKMFCLNCGCQMNGETGTGKSKVYHYYKCSGRKRHITDCTKATIKQENIEEYILDKIDQYILETSYID